MQYHLLEKRQPAGEWLAGHLGLCRALSMGTLALELLFPVAIAIRRLRPLFLLGGLAFHLGTIAFRGRRVLARLGPLPPLRPLDTLALAHPAAPLGISGERVGFGLDLRYGLSDQARERDSTSRG